jgi:hypothetical protein
VTGSPAKIITLDEGEYITGIFGRELDYVYQLGLTSNVRQYAPLGGENGRTFNILSIVVGFVGAVRGDILSAIGVWGLDSVPQPPPTLPASPPPLTRCTGEHSLQHSGLGTG